MRHCSPIDLKLHCAISLQCPAPVLGTTVINHDDQRFRRASPSHLITHQSLEGVHDIPRDGGDGQAACLALRSERARLRRTLCPAILMPGSMSALMSSSVTAQRRCWWLRVRMGGIACRVRDEMGRGGGGRCASPFEICETSRFDGSSRHETRGPVQSVD